MRQKREPGREAVVLIVDDHEHVRGLLRTVVSSQLSARVLEAATGAEALEALAAEPVDILLLDLQLPDMTGEDVLRRSGKRPPELLTIVVSGETDAQRIGALQELGVSTFVQKPFHLQAFLHSFRGVLEQMDGD